MVWYVFFSLACEKNSGRGKHKLEVHLPSFLFPIVKYLDLQTIFFFFFFTITYIVGGFSAAASAGT